MIHPFIAYFCNPLIVLNDPSLAITAVPFLKDFVPLILFKFYKSLDISCVEDLGHR